MKQPRLSILAAFLLAGCATGVLTFDPGGGKRGDQRGTATMPVANPAIGRADSGTGPGADPSAGQIMGSQDDPGGPGHSRAAPGSDAGRPETSGGDRQAVLGAGAIRVTVKWPDYRIQAIPASTTRINVKIMDGSTEVASAEINRPSQNQAYISGLSPATYTVQLSALRPDFSTVVASASANVQVKVNEVAAATIALVPTFQPRLDSVEALSNGQLSLRGSNLSFVGAATHSVWIDGVALPQSSYTSGTPGDQQILVTSLPPGTVSGVIDLSIDGIRIPVSDRRSFVLGSLSQPVDHIALAPAPGWTAFPILKKGENQRLLATLWADADETATTDAPIDWEIFKIEPEPPVGENKLSISGGYLFLADTLTEAATATIRAKAGGKIGQVEVVLQP